MECIGENLGYFTDCEFIYIFESKQLKAGSDGLKYC